MHLKLRIIFYAGLLVTSVWVAGHPFVSSAASSSAWSLSSVGNHCDISVFLSDDGSLSYQVSRDRTVVIPRSPLGLVRDDQSFDQALVVDSIGDVVGHHEIYDLFSGAHIHVDHVVNQRALVFHNTNGARIELDLAATEEGVAFRYRFTETNRDVHIVKSESTGFVVPRNSRGWLQPYHAAGPYTPAYEDFFFNVSPGDPPPNSRAKAVGCVFFAFFLVSVVVAWVLFCVSGTDESYCACH